MGLPDYPRGSIAHEIAITLSGQRAQRLAKLTPHPLPTFMDTVRVNILPARETGLLLMGRENEEKEP